MIKPILLVMAAGMGSRYGGLKQIDKMTNEGEIILDYSLYDAYKAGFRKAVFIIKKENLADFQDIFKDGAEKFLDIEYVFQEISDLPDGYEVPDGREKPWGTGHAIMTARKAIKEPFAVINADDFYGREAFKEMYSFLKKVCDEKELAKENSQERENIYPFSMVAYEIKNTITENGTVSRGVCDIDSEGYLAHIVERHNIGKKGDKIVFVEGDKEYFLEDDTKVSMNFWGYTEDIMRELEDRFPEFLDKAFLENPLKAEYLIPEVTDSLIKSGKATCLSLKSKDKWHGVTYKEDKESVKLAIEELKKEGIYPRKLWE